MKIIWILSLMMASSLASLAGSDEGSNPVSLKKEIQQAQFIFIGSLKVDSIRFIENGQIVEDKDGLILKAFQTDRYENVKIIPEWVRRWVTIKPNEMLRGDAELAAPFLKETWVEPSLVACPHHSNALSGQKRIWLVVLKDNLSDPSLISMPVRHLKAVRKIIAAKE